MVQPARYAFGSFDRDRRTISCAALLGISSLPASFPYDHSFSSPARSAFAARCLTSARTGIASSINRTSE